MTEYMREAKSGALLSTVHGTANAILTLLTAEELRAEGDKFPHHKELLRSLGSIRYCKAEIYRDGIWGTLRIPSRNEKQREPLSFVFYLTEERLYFIEDGGELKQWLKSAAHKLQEFETPSQLLLRFLELFVENDVLYLSHLEKELDGLEDLLLNDIPSDFFTGLTRHRRKLSELNGYYEQLTAMADLISDSPALISNPDQWDRFALQTVRLESHVHMLQENVIQLRELYQAQLDAKQNKVMCILTVVTTLFLPLSLLTGWYGMNFANMPELRWRYAYPTVIVVTVIIIIIEIIYFKKKKIL